MSQQREYGMSQNRSVKLMVLLGITIVSMLVMFFILVPYEVETYSINRKTGLQPGVFTYWGIYTTSRPMNVTHYYEKFGTFTATERLMPCLRITKRFPWSTREGEDLAPGSKYADVFDELFSSLRRWSPSEGERQIPADELEAAMRRRIPIWNSSEVDRDPQAIIERIRMENYKLHRLPAPAP
jgi:hypothetical protein